ncbi:MAG: hypothetical protein AABZ06_03245 [Bdellovibrionota bacterium]
MALCLAAGCSSTKKTDEDELTESSELTPADTLPSASPEPQVSPTAQPPIKAVPKPKKITEKNIRKAKKKILEPEPSPISMPTVVPQIVAPREIPKPSPTTRVETRTMEQPAKDTSSEQDQPSWKQLMRDNKAILGAVLLVILGALILVFRKKPQE